VYLSDVSESTQLSLIIERGFGGSGTTPGGLIMIAPEMRGCEAANLDISINRIKELQPI
jgi:hypothetical protein